MIILKSSFEINTDLLLNILENEKDAYLDDSIKFIISNLCEIFARKDRRLIYSNIYFLCCINELKIKYNKNISEKNKFTEIMDKHYKTLALKFLEKLQKWIYINILMGFFDIRVFLF